jgi:hypothetical protein
MPLSRLSFLDFFSFFSFILFFISAALHADTREQKLPLRIRRQHIDRTHARNQQHKAAQRERTCVIKVVLFDYSARAFP